MKEKTKRKNLILISSLIVFAISFLLFYIIFSPPQIVGNKRIMSEVADLVALSLERPLSESDLAGLTNDVKSDPVAKRLVDNALWFVRNDIPEHMSHKLSDLYKYVDKGKYEVCIPQEVEHLEDFIAFEDFEELNETMKLVEENYIAWLTRARNSQQRFPSLYTNLDELIEKINSVLDKIKSNNFNISEEIEFISQNINLGCSGV